MMTEGSRSTIQCCGKTVGKKPCILWSVLFTAIVIGTTVGIIIWYVNRDTGEVDQETFEEDETQTITKTINATNGTNGTQTITVTQIVSFEYSWYLDGGDYAVSGKDVVEYFSLDSSDNGVDGDEAYQTEWQGVSWLFKDQTNLDLFEANPTDYAPRFGGYCAYAMASGSSASGNANAWTVYNGQLYINFNKNVRSTWSNNKDRNIEDADEHWGEGSYDWDNWDVDF